MGTLGDIGQVLSYGIGVGANTRADELIKQSEMVRKAGMERLKFNYGIQSADYKHNLDMERDTANRSWDQEKQRMSNARWMQGEDNKMKRLGIQATNRNNQIDKEYGYRFGLEKMKGQGGNALTAISKELNLLANQDLPTSFAQLESLKGEDKAYLDYIAQGEDQAKGSKINPFDNKKFKPVPYLEFAQKMHPQMFAAAQRGEQLTSTLVGSPQQGKQQVAKKQIKSEAGLRQVVGMLKGKQGTELWQALKEMKDALDDESYQKVVNTLGLGKRKKSALGKVAKPLENKRVGLDG